MSISTERAQTYVTRALEIFADYGDREALVQDDRRLSYRDLHTTVLRMAATLRAS